MSKKKIISLLKKYSQLILLSLILLLVGFFFFKKFMTFLLLLVFSVFFQFFSYELKVRLNFGHVFFLSMVILRYIGVLESIVFIVISEYYPKLLNTDIDMKSLVLIPLEILFVLLLLVIDTKIATIGIILAVIYHILGFIVAKYFGDTLVEIASEIGVSFFLNIVYFVSLSGPMTYLVANVIA